MNHIQIQFLLSLNFVFSKPAGYSDINGILNPEAERECQNHLVQALTVQMGSMGRESDLPSSHSGLVAISRQGPDSGEPLHRMPDYG